MIVLVGSKHHSCFSYRIKSPIYIIYILKQLIVISLLNHLSTNEIFFLDFWFLCVEHTVIPRKVLCGSFRVNILHEVVFTFEDFFASHNFIWLSPQWKTKAQITPPPQKKKNNNKKQKIGSKRRRDIVIIIMMMTMIMMIIIITII